MHSKLRSTSPVSAVCTWLVVSPSSKYGARCVQDHAALSNALQPAFQRPDACKIGLELTSDLRKLARSYAHMDAFAHAECCLDLKQLWQLHSSAPAEGDRFQPGSPRRSKSVGLSFLAQKLLGKPLDKAMQVRGAQLLGILPLVANNVGVPLC